MWYFVAASNQTSEVQPASSNWPSECYGSNDR